MIRREGLKLFIETRDRLPHVRYPCFPVSRLLFNELFEMANQRYEANESAIDKAKRLGTYGKIDRSAQYENELDGLDSVQLRRKLQAKYDELFKKTRDLEQVKFWHRAALMSNVIRREGLKLFIETRDRLPHVAMFEGAIYVWLDDEIYAWRDTGVDGGEWQSVPPSEFPEALARP